jgi:hypothetical protein
VATSDPITPFPADIDRDYFGAWLSGFTDGEGCFRLYLNGLTRTPAAAFVIALRDDDKNVLALIRSFLSCGSVNIKKRILPSKPQATFRVDRIADLATLIVPHFERFPLVAKKAMDFGLWKQGVSLIYAVNHRPIRLRWTKEDRQQFYDIQDSLCEQRRYKES